MLGQRQQQIVTLLPFGSGGSGANRPPNGALHEWRCEHGHVTSAEVASGTGFQPALCRPSRKCA